MRHGQRVRLKIGGRIMFVVGAADGRIRCAYFDAYGRHELGYFESDLELV